MVEKPVIPDAASELATLRATLASVVEERDAALQARPAKKPATGRGVTSILPPMPQTRVPHELGRWMHQCHQELRDVLDFGETTRVLELTSMLNEAAVRWFHEGEV